MGREEEPVRGNAARDSMFERVIAMKLRKSVEQCIESVVEDCDWSEEISEGMNEIVNDIIGTKAFKDEVKNKVLQMFEQEKLTDRFAKRIVDKMLSE